MAMALLFIKCVIKCVCVCVCVVMIKCKNNPLCQKCKVERSEQERKMVMGVLTREMESHAIIHSSFLHP